jgi:hypothetical protein
MTIFSAKEDFWCRSLASFSGPVSRLEYVSGLRQESGVYSHWGMARSHGEAAANQAIAGAHAQIFAEILQTPLSLLLQELRSLASEHGTEPHELLQTLIARRDALVPHSLDGGSRLHFNSVLQALSALARTQAPGDDRAA